MGIYAASKLTCEQQEHIAVLKEEGMFCRGGTLIPKDHVLYGTVLPSQMRPMQHLW